MTPPKDSTIETICVTIVQPRDTWSPNKGDNTMGVEVVYSPAGDHYVTIKTERFAFNDHEEVIQLANFIKELMSTVESAKAKLN